MERLWIALVWTALTGAFQIAAMMVAILIYAAGGTGDQMLATHGLALAASQGIWLWLNR